MVEPVGRVEGAGPAWRTWALAGQALRPADAARRALLAALGPLARPLVNRRSLRVAIFGAWAVLTSLLVTIWAPLWLLALGPLALGVPHLVADVRYLVLRPGLHRRRALWLLCGPPLLWAAAGGGAVSALLVIGGALAAARPQGLRRPARWAALGLVLAAAPLAWRHGARADLALAHGHNVVALLLLWAWRRRDDRLHLVPLGLFAVGSALLLGGALDGWAARGLGGPFAGPAGLGVGYHAAWLAPGAGPTWGLRLVLAFAFAQSVHYAVWLRLIPEEDRPRRTPRTFAASLRALLVDFGAAPLALCAAAALALALWALRDLAGARVGYLRMALFHGPLELGAAALWIFEGRRGTGPSDGSQ